MSFVEAIKRRIRQFYLRMRGVRMSGKCWIRNVDIPRNHSQIELGNGVALDQHVTLLVSGELNSETKIKIGDRTYINRNVMIDAAQSIVIESDCMIGPFCYVADSDHGTRVGLLVREQPMTSEPVLIEAGAWIGAHVTILKGVTIGAGAVVGAGSVVTKDVPANSIVAGVPAKVLRNRPV